MARRRSSSRAAGYRPRTAPPPRPPPDRLVVAPGPGRGEERLDRVLRQRGDEFAADGGERLVLRRAIERDEALAEQVAALRAERGEAFLIDRAPAIRSAEDGVVVAAAGDAGRAVDAHAPGDLLHARGRP